MYEVANRTPFTVRLSAGLDRENRDIAFVVVKGTYHAREGAPLGLASADAEPIHLTDRHWGEPGESSVRYEAETAWEKPGTDIVLNGSAYPAREGDTSAIVELRVGPQRKAVRVYGDRVWARTRLGEVALSAPRRFESMPLVYERAFGGKDTSHADPSFHESEARNPVGVGFVATSSARALEEIGVPNLEDPSSPIAKPSDRPPPAALAFVHRSWSPRARLAGTYDEAWRAARAPYLPVDFAVDHHRAAPAGLSSPAHLRGGEGVSAVGVRRRGGALSFTVPPPAFEVSFRVRGRDTTIEPVLTTVVIEPDASRVLCTWHAALACPKRLLFLDRVVVRERRPS